ncbi:response regulator [Paenibacillus sp. NEAU-GSW1]|uniref:response regulator n=1 Tax=Paenibacillus sp. NEAU-GSW1 TaxID=2682486 RepID=UPI0012E2C813|nr:response regulator [Paenibacillus sp. NEAU-GSW1]MUT66963.1 response regulator [Paenibacillus sp. NEAU-GSW1]
MYKVLIIDDEEPLREAIRILGNWEKFAVEEVLEAENGKLGLEMLASSKIDLVMVDMKMPEMNGIQFLQQMERQYPDLLTIVISGYNDFDYTRQAIRSKVVDYLLKPINRQDLNSALGKAVDLMEAKRKRESEFIANNITLNMSLPKLKEKVYWSIIEQSFKKKSNEAFLPLIGADEAGNHFAVIIFRLLNMDHVRETRFNNDSELLIFAASNVLNEMADSQFRSFSFVNPTQEREMIAILTMTGSVQLKDVAFHARHKTAKAVSALRELFGVAAISGYGGAEDDVIQLSSSYQRAKSALNGIDLLHLKEGAAADAVVEEGLSQQSKESMIASLTSRFAHVRSGLESGNVHHAKSVITELADKWRAMDRLAIGDMDRTLNEFIILLNDLSLEQGVMKDRLPLGGMQSLRKLGQNCDFGSFEQYEVLLQKLIDYFSNEIRKSQTANKPFDISDIKSYIDDNYFEDIKISMFTEKYFLSREYLMKLFKGQFGCGIHEYVQKVRMEKAKVLLDDPSMKIQDISERLGFKDKNYFSKAFRNYFDISPSEYRSDQLKV